jgi:hypothetical protein
VRLLEILMEGIAQTGEQIAMLARLGAGSPAGLQSYP